MKKIKNWQPPKNKSGTSTEAMTPGVYLQKNGKYNARWVKDGIVHNLGTFETEAAAIQARIADLQKNDIAVMPDGKIKRTPKKSQFQAAKRYDGAPTGIKKGYRKSGEAFYIASINDPTKSSHTTQVGTFATEQEAVNARNLRLNQLKAKPKKKQDQVNLRDQYEAKRVDGVVMPLFKAKTRSDNKTGYKGVVKHGNRFEAHLTVNGTHYHQYGLLTAEEAHKARLALEAAYLPHKEETR